MTTTHPTLGEARLPRNPLLSEVLELVSKQKTKAKKIQTLKQYESLHLKSVLIWNFDESVKSMLPDGDVPFNKNEAPAGTEHLHLAYEWKKLYNFVKGGKDSEHQILREAYGHLGKPKARKIKDYFNVILEDAKRYEKERRRGRRKITTK